MITLKNVSFSFPSSKKPALDSISFSLEAGDFCVVLGTNGSGKSTLLRAIMKEISVAQGTVSFLFPEQKTTIQPHFSVVTQDIKQGTVGQLSVFENFMLTNPPKLLQLASLYSTEREKVFNYLKESQTGLETFFDTPLENLSGGQRQLIALLMAFYRNPDILLLDEHTAALDPATKEMVMNFTEKLTKKMGITTLMITHDIKDAINYGNRLIMLNQGQLILDLNENQKKSLTQQELIQLFFFHKNDVLKKGDLL